MEKYMKRLVVFILIGLLLCGCAPKVEPECACEIDWDEKVTVNFDTWNENTDSLYKLKEYVEDVTDKTSEHFIPVEDRIAVFDMDGTLISTEESIVGSYEELFRVFDKVENFTEDKRKEVIGPPLKELFPKYFPGVEYDTLYKVYRAKQIELSKVTNHPTPNTPEVLRAKNRLKFGTNCSSFAIIPVYSPSTPNIKL